jgi:hypothetical protein
MSKDWLHNFICGEFLGMPLAQTPAGSDDCLRYDYHLKIDGVWYEICTECLSFSKKEAFHTLHHIFRKLSEVA